MSATGGEGDPVPALTPDAGMGGAPPPACPECPIVDVIEGKEHEARTAAWAGVFVAILGALSWNTWGFLVCGLGAIGFGLYAREFAPREAMADLVAGAMLLVVFALRIATLL